MAVPRLTAVQTWQQWKGDLQRGTPARLAPSAKWGNDARVAQVAEIVTHSPQWKEWQDCFIPTAGETFNDFWRSLAPNHRTVLADLSGRRNRLCEEARPLIEAYAELAIYRDDHLQACRTWIASDREFLATAHLDGRVAPWLASLPTSALYFLYCAQGDTSEARMIELRKRVRMALRDYPAEDIVPTAVVPKVSAVRPRPMTLTDAIRRSPAWREYEDIAEVTATTLEAFHSALQPFERELLWEIVDNGAIFDRLLIELLSVFDTYSDMIYFISTEIMADETLAVLFHRRRSGALVADPWLHLLSLSQILTLLCASNGGFAATCHTLLDRVPNPLPPGLSTEGTLRHRELDTPVPQQLPEQPYAIDASYINRTLTQRGISANVRKLASAVIEELPVKHHEWTLTDKARALTDRDGFYSYRLGIRHRLIYALNTDTRTIHIYFVGSHADYDHVTSAGRAAAMRDWAAQRGIR